MPPYDIEIIPIYMSCTECSLYLGNVEEEYADDLDGMCLKCFREQTEQTHYWYDIPISFKKGGCKMLSDREKFILHFVSMMIIRKVIEYRT